MAQCLTKTAEEKDNVAEEKCLVRVCHATVTLGGHKALNDVSLTVRTGEHLVLRGGNGAGKSTLLRLIRGEQWPDQTQNNPFGQSQPPITWFPAEGPSTSPLAGRDLAALTASAQQERIMAQGWNITGEDLIFGGITETAFVLRRPQGQAQRDIHNLASWLEAQDLLDRFVPTLSQGQLRLVLVARALIRKPALLLLDEVTDGLDRQTRHTLLNVLEKASRISTLIISTHRPETLPAWMGAKNKIEVENRSAAEAISERMTREIVLDNGHIVSQGPVVYAKNPKTSQQTPHISFQETDPSMHLSAWHDDSATNHEAAAPTSPSEARPVVPTDGAEICLDHVTVFVESTPVLHDVSWHIMPGQNWAILGGNGAGKSTLLRLLAGDEFPALGGRITRRLPRQGGLVTKLKAIRKGIRLVSDRLQATYTYALTGSELVFSGIDNAVGVYRMLTPAESDEVAHAMARLGVSHLQQRSIRACSTGEMRRLLLARALVGNPDLLLLDEPCSGLDPKARCAFMDILETLLAQGVQMVMVTHHENDILSAVTHQLELNNGYVIK